MSHAPGPTSEELADFVSVLRRCGFEIGAGQCISAQRLLVALAAQGDRLERPRELAGLLAPIFCVSREEQETFPVLYEQWLSTQPSLFAGQQKAAELSPSGPDRKDETPTPPLRFGRLVLNWMKRPSFGYGLTAGLSLVALLVWYFDLLGTAAPKNPKATPVQPPTPTPVLTLSPRVIVALVALLLLVIGALWALRRWRRLVLRKWRTKQQPRLRRLTVQLATEQLKRLYPLRRMAQELRFYRQNVTYDLDVGKTVRATVTRGLFTPAYVHRKSLPEYLVLIDRTRFDDERERLLNSGLDDQQARLLDAVMAQLALTDVFIDRFYFKGDPTVYSTDGPLVQYYTLNDLAARYPEHYLLIFSDGGGFFNPVTGRPRDWLGAFAAWEMRALLTPEFRLDPYRERVLTESGFKVLPADPEGLAALGHALYGGALSGLRERDVRALPPVLRGGDWAWTSAQPPPTEDINLLCRQVEDFLGLEGYRWLSACAVYPLLQWDLTLYLGYWLGGEGQLPETFAALMRLPWFRLGSMPDWLRERLILGMTPALEQSVRDALTELLLSSQRRSAGFVLPIAHEPEEDREASPLSRLSLRRVLRRLSGEGRKRLGLDSLKHAPRDSLLRDYVLLSFMKGRRPNRLALTLPDELRETLAPPGLSGADMWLVRGLILLVIVFSAALPLAVAATVASDDAWRTVAGCAVIMACWATLNIGALRQFTSPAGESVFVTAGWLVERLSNISGQLRETFLARKYRPLELYLHGSRVVAVGCLLGSVLSLKTMTSPVVPTRVLVLLSLTGLSSLLLVLFSEAVERFSPAEALTDMGQPRETGGAAHDQPITVELARDQLSPSREGIWSAWEIDAVDPQAPPVKVSLAERYGQLTPKLQRLWRALAVFHGTFDSLAAAAVWELGAAAAQDALNELVGYHLVSWKEYTVRYSLHDAARRLAEASLSSEERSASRTRHAEHYLGVLRKADELYSRGGDALAGGLALFEYEWRNIQAGQLSAQERADRDAAAAALCSAYPSAGAHLLKLRMPLPEQLRWLRAALAAARRLNLSDAEGKHLESLGNAYVDIGETSPAIELYEQALDIARKKRDRRDEGRVLGDLGLAYSYAGDPRQAIRLGEDALAIARKDRQRGDEARALGVLGVAYHHLGDSRRAVEFHEQHLAIAREDGDQHGEGLALSKLGAAYAKLQQHSRAVLYYEQCLAICQAVGDRGLQGNALFNLGLVLFELGDRTRATTHALAGLKIFNQLESPHAETVRATLARWAHPLQH